MAYYYGDLSIHSDVEKLQMRAVRLVAESHYVVHTEPLFKRYYKLNAKN